MLTTETEDGRDGNGGRWGNKRVDGRDWATYNEELVVRGEFLLPAEELLGVGRRAGLHESGEDRESREAPLVRVPGFPFAFLAVLTRAPGWATSAPSAELKSILVAALLGPFWPCVLVDMAKMHGRRGPRYA
ncbi:MAG: hypothetical protein ACP5UD_09415 [Conexivisphaera sp.]